MLLASEFTGATRRYPVKRLELTQLFPRGSHVRHHRKGGLAEMGAIISAAASDRFPLQLAAFQPNVRSAYHVVNPPRVSCLGPGDIISE